MQYVWRLALILVLLICLTGTLLQHSASVVLAGRAAPALEQVASPTDDADERWRQWDRLPFMVKAKVDPRILAELRGEVRPAHLNQMSPANQAPVGAPQPLEHTRFLVYLHQQPDLSVLADRVFASEIERRAELLALLTSATTAAQAEVRSALDNGLATQAVTAYQPFFIVNTLAVDGDLATLVALAQRQDVARILANYPLQTMQNEVPAPSASGVVGEAALDPANWNIELVGADRVWSELGVRGEGAVVASFDTGVNWQHPALANNYRGLQANGGVNHNYNWFEPDGRLYADGNLGPSLSAEPYDCSGHGTHTTGTMVGDGGEPGLAIGMAPDATWIALPGICFGTMPGGIQDDIGGLKAFQWLLCPTDLSGDLATADCSMAPDVVNNSWGSANPQNDLFRPALQRLRAAGVAPVFAAGNPSAGVGSIGSPGSAPEAITVAATDAADQVADFSGRGPSYYSGEQKPELSAPGVNVLSAVGTDYSTGTGTSMAAPHVAGLVALLVSADLRDGRRDFTVDEIERLMVASVRDLGAAGPDNDYGYGRIDAFRAVNWALNAADVRGAVRNEAGAAIAGASIVAIDGAGRQHTTTSGPSGLFSTTMPAGAYRVQVTAWGYAGAAELNLELLPGSVSLADFALRPQPVMTVSGQVTSQGAPLAAALVQVVEQPQRQARTAADGSYTILLPVGVHTLLVEAPGQRSQQRPVMVSESTAGVDFALSEAPSILLVEADAAGGWFFGWPLAEFYRSALTAQHYQFDHWRIEDVTITDTVTTTVGARVQGIPSLDTLARYDVVIWAHNGCSIYWSCPYRLTDSPLPAYLANGGRLIYSAQDAAFLDGSPLLDDGFHADSLLSNAASEGDTVRGADFLQGLQFTLTNASLYGYANGSIPLSPDAVTTQPGDGAAYPVLLYDNGSGSAALATDPCNGAGRAIYLAIGYENLAHRGPARDPAIYELLGRSLAWLQGERPPNKVLLSALQEAATTLPGQVARYEIKITNAGTAPASLTLSLAENRWPTRIVSGTQEIGSQLLLEPCAAQDLALVVSPPADALPNSAATSTLTVTDANQSGAAQQVALQTRLAVAWQRKPPAAAPRYGHGVTAVGEHTIYSVGGWYDDFQFFFPTAATTVERYDSCRRVWSPQPALPEPLGDVAVATLGGKIYTVGGQLFSFGNFEYLRSAAVYLFDPATESWSAVAPLPEAYAGMAAATVDGTLYAFGGVNGAGLASARVWAYDPVSNQWSARSPMPGGARYFLAAAALGGKVYVVGGWPELRTVEVYDPATDSWSKGTPLLQGRRSAAAVAGPDGALYVIGGSSRLGALGSTARFDPQTNAWTVSASLSDSNRLGVGAAYAGGEILAVGGQWSTQNEAMLLGSSFCQSEKRLVSGVILPSIPTTYTVKVVAGMETLTNVGVVDPIPAGLRFVDFIEQPPGARYNAELRQVEWRGDLPANAPTVNLVYRTELTATQWTSGDLIRSEVGFYLGETLAFSRTATGLLLTPDFSASYLIADQPRSKSGDVTTYTIQLQGINLAGGPLELVDPLPPGVTYVPDSLRYPVGAGSYDPLTQAIHWSGVIPPGQSDSQVRTYLWGDSDGQGDLKNVTFAWEDITASGTRVSGYDDAYTCGLPIGFAFPFFAETQHEFCLSTNGFISFDRFGYSDLANDCPLPSLDGNEALIAAIWDDLIIEDGMTYSLQGEEPLRRLVVQWSGARRFGFFTNRLAEFQAILYETGQIKIQVRLAGALTGGESTTGLEDSAADEGVVYACNRPRTLHDQLAIVFTPNTAGQGSTVVQFQVRHNEGVGVNTWITNTATISTSSEILQRSVATLVNPLDLSASSVTLSNSEVTPDGTITFTLNLRNSGLITANALLTMTAPTPTTVLAGSLQCTLGVCSEDGSTIRWQGALAPATPVTITFGLRLTTPLPDRTPVTSEISLADGYGNVYEQSISFLARRADLRSSTVQLRPPYVEPGDEATVLLFVQNTGALDTHAAIEHRPPAELAIVAGSLTCSVAGCTLADGLLRWSGAVPARSLVQLSYRVQIPISASYGASYSFDLQTTDLEWGELSSQTATLWVADLLHLPLIVLPPEIRLLLPLVHLEEKAAESVTRRLVQRDK